MSTLLRRGKLTDELLELLAGTGKPVGDGEAPKDAGWSSDQNAPDAVFTPYSVLASLPASRSMGDFADSQDMWIIPYKLICVGVSRQQCDWMADKALDALDGVARQIFVLGAYEWKVMQVQLLTLDGAARIDTSEPPYWQRGDAVTVWLTKEL